MKDYKGKKCIVRGNRSGVFYGEIVDRKGQEVELKNCRRLWYWDGANSLSDVALIGTTKPGNCKFTAEVEKLTIVDLIEFIPCTEKATKVIEGVKEWTRKK